MIRLAFPLAAYPFIIHYAVINGHAALAVTVACLPLAAGGLLSLRGKSRAGYLVVTLVGAGIVWLGAWTGIFSIVYLPPVLIAASLCGLFAGTLLPGRTPLITRFAALQHGVIDLKIERYTRRLTQLWSCFFLCLAVEAIALALFAPLHVWSLFTNFINYLFVMVFFAVEYLVRINVLHHVRHPGFLPFLQSLVKFAPGSALKER